MKCSRCDEYHRNGSLISIMGDEIFICEYCERSKVGTTAECERCHKMAVIYHQDDIFQNVECKECYDKQVAHIQECVAFYKQMEAKNKQ